MSPTGSEIEYFWNHANVEADIASIKPLGDAVLVRVIPEPEMAGLIVFPTGARELGYQAPRIGEVIACGPGDKIEWVKCEGCGHRYSLSEENKMLRTQWRCPKCRIKSVTSFIHTHPRHHMHVKPGDRILYWRCQANEVVINEETYQFLHEEQHVLAVLEN